MSDRTEGRAVVGSRRAQGERTAAPDEVVLIDRTWPSGASPALLRKAMLIVAGVVLIAAAARIHVPLPLVPMTLQTLAVLLVGAAYGARLGAVTVLLYVVAGAAGLPVFAGGGGSLASLSGPTGGFLAGFIVAAALTGRLVERGWERPLWRLLALMVLGHAVIVLLGFLWLAFGFGLGAAKAWRVGVSPFLAGAAVKSVLGVIILLLLQRLANARR